VASVVPAVIVSLVVLAVMLTILGGIISYYSAIYTEPVLLPAYGSVYVKDVDPVNGTVVIVNKYGYSVKALFSVRVTKITPNPNFYVPPMVSFWRTILPGWNEINLSAETRLATGLTESYNVTIDVSSSYFIIGSLRYPIVKGAGLFNPFNQASSTYKRYSAQGTGILNIPASGIYATLYFTDKRIDVSNYLETRFSYYRSIFGYDDNVVKLVQYEHGIRCRCYPWWCWVSSLKYDPVTNTTYCETHSIRLNNCGTGDYTQFHYNRYACAYDGGLHLYGVSVSSSLYTTLNTIALYGLTYFTKGFSVDYVEKSGGGTSYQTESFPYIKPNQNECKYDYVDMEYSANLIPGSCTECLNCGEICYEVSFNSCVESVNVSVTRDQWACGDKMCAGADYFFYVRIRNMYNNITSQLSTGGSIRLSLNLTHTLDYYFAKTDPELADSYVRLVLANPLTLTLPKVAGYLSVKYTDEDPSVSVAINLNVKGVYAMLRTESGYTAMVPIYVSPGYTVIDAILTPVGYVSVSGRGLESAKTYRYETPGSISLSVDMRSHDILIPISGRDTIYVTIILELEIIPSVNIGVSEVSG